MPRLRIISSRFTDLFRRGRRDRDLDAELESHLQFHIDENVARGMTPEEARRQALIALGGIEQTKESYRDRRGLPWLDSLWQDARFSQRILRKYAKLSCIAVASIAIGMGATSTGLSFLNALLLRPPAVPNPGRILSIYSIAPRGYMEELSYHDYQYVRDNNRTFSEVAIVSSSWDQVSSSLGGRQKDVVISGVSDNYFTTLGIQPVLGPGFPSGEDNPRAMAVLSYSYWKWLGGDPGIIGKTLLVGHALGIVTNAGANSDVPLTIVGVAPEKFAGTTLVTTPDFWYPIAARGAVFRDGDYWQNQDDPKIVSVAGRLKPGVTQQQALGDVQRMARELASIYPDANDRWTEGVAPLTMLPQEQKKSLRLFSILVIVVIGLVLFAACANVTNLLLALAGVRRQEILVRATLGATRMRLARQLLLDSTIIASAGGLLGFALASYGLGRLTGMRPTIPLLGSLPFSLDFRPDWGVLAAVVAVIFVVGFAMGILPALHASTPQLATALNGEVGTGGRRKSLTRNLLVIAQVAACTVISVGVGICVKSLSTVERANTGYSARNVAILMTENMQARGYTEEQGRALYERVREAASRLPGIQSVSLAGSQPLNYEDGNVQAIDAWDHVRPGAPATFEIVDGNYFSTVGVPLLAGRVFTDADSENSARVVVINRAMAERYWPNENPIGRSFRINDEKKKNATVQLTVVGVVGNSAHSSPDEPPFPNLYFPRSQRYWPQLHLLVRTEGDPTPLMKPMGEIVKRADPNLAFGEHTLADTIRLREYVPHLALSFAGAFGALAWMLAAVGLYGSVFYSVSERTREMGIRVTLGAQPWDLWRMVLREIGAVACGGVCVGLGGGIALTIVVRSWLHGIQAVEWSVLLGVACAIGLLALASAYLAARPWMRVDPMKSVRHA